MKFINNQNKTIMCDYFNEKQPSKQHSINDELKPIFEKEQILVEEIKTKKYTFEEARDKCKELYDMVPVTYLVDFFALQQAMDEVYPSILDPGFKRVYKIPVGNISDEEMGKYLQKILNL
jgi:hypothetical protein